MADQQLAFVHMPKTAGTTFDRILMGLMPLMGKPRVRADGTIYGQFLGPDKTEAADYFRNVEKERILQSSFFAGHVTLPVWRERIVPD